MIDAEITNVLLDDFDKFEHFAMTYWKQIGGLAVAIVDNQIKYMEEVIVPNSTLKSTS